MSGLFESFVEVRRAGGVTEFGYPLWLTLLTTGLFLVLVALAVVFAVRSKVPGGISLLLSLGASVAVVPTFWVDGTTVRANQFVTCSWQGFEYEMQLRSLDQYRAVVRLLGEDGSQELHLTSKDGQAEVWTADDLLTPMALDEIADQLAALQVPIVDRR
ncbi:MAG: hypothetical protein AAF196_15195 [Planctomycetota bacterium]